MASYLFTCVKCLGLARLSDDRAGFVPPADFDHICVNCKAEELPVVVKPEPKAKAKRK